MHPHAVPRLQLQQRPFPRRVRVTLRGRVKEPRIVRAYGKHYGAEEQGYADASEPQPARQGRVSEGPDEAPTLPRESYSGQPQMGATVIVHKGGERWQRIDDGWAREDGVTSSPRRR